MVTPKMSIFFLDAEHCARNREGYCADYFKNEKHARILLLRLRKTLPSLCRLKTRLKRKYDIIA